MPVGSAKEYVHIIQEKNPVQYMDMLATLSLMCHSASVSCNWWHAPDTITPLERNFGELVALIHSEVSEAMEGGRKDKQDEHLPRYKSVEVELADALIRIFDLAYAANLNLGGGCMAKWEYNLLREDHKLDKRQEEGGKQF